MSDISTEVKTKTKLKEPSLYKVVFHNDDYTPMDFVVAVLIQLFEKTQKEAEQIMLHVHTNGRGIAGTYTYEIANQKKIESIRFAQSNQFPLKVTVEET